MTVNDSNLYPISLEEQLLPIEVLQKRICITNFFDILYEMIIEEGGKFQD